MAHFAFALGALTARGRRLGPAMALLSALFLVAALATWRVAFLFPVLETGFVLAWMLARPPSPALRDWFGVVVALGTVACVALPYLRDQNFILSPAWLIAMTLAVALWAPWLRREDAPFPRRALIVAAVIAVAVAIGSIAPVERQYARVLEAAAYKAAAFFGATPAPPAAARRLRVGRIGGDTWATCSAPADRVACGSGGAVSSGPRAAARRARGERCRHPLALLAITLLFDATRCSAPVAGSSSRIVPAPLASRRSVGHGRSAARAPTGRVRPAPARVGRRARPFRLALAPFRDHLAATLRDAYRLARPACRRWSRDWRRLPGAKADRRHRLT